MVGSFETRGQLDWPLAPLRVEGVVPSGTGVRQGQIHTEL